MHTYYVFFFLSLYLSLFFFFFFTDTATTEIYTLSLHDALPIYAVGRVLQAIEEMGLGDNTLVIYIFGDNGARDRKSTRLNSSHRCISYAVFCLKKKKKKNKNKKYTKKK